MDKKARPDPKTKKRHLQFACRRGMLELDVMLNAYLAVLDRIDIKEQTLFERLLRCEDQVLFQWLVAQEKPSKPYQQIVTRIIDHARHSI